MVWSFGDDGVVDLSRDLIWPIDRSHFEFNAAPVIYKDLAMTYRSGTGRQFVLIATGSGASQELVAFAPPE